ncbi:hypothetical protein [Acaryochloris sp. CCMEE 5410]|uniref:hypothetical protein n=1 Tax=Acaryochloris sp. CCMEE 5410 TaxID=310037 RepID=UPI0003092D33|nr:hypothetical protein [Acaryochloris sp. CCMEE 5410]KAI9131903.1 hypothetical protein ON05_027035 [Acaryochloris sp. CCMEE 5410]
MANVEVPAILALASMGFTIASRVVNADQEMVWTASGKGNEYVAEDPLSLLGLTKLHEVRGDNWKASDDEIDKYLPMLEGDV